MGMARLVAEGMHRYLKEKQGAWR